MLAAQHFRPSVPFFAILRNVFHESGAFFQPEASPEDLKFGIWNLESVISLSKIRSEHNSERCKDSTEFRIWQIFLRLLRTPLACPHKLLDLTPRHPRRVIDVVLAKITAPHPLAAPAHALPSHTARLRNPHPVYVERHLSGRCRESKVRLYEREPAFR